MCSSDLPVRRVAMSIKYCVESATVSAPRERLANPQQHIGDHVGRDLCIRRLVASSPCVEAHGERPGRLERLFEPLG